MRTFCCSSSSSSFLSLPLPLLLSLAVADGFWGVAEISSRFLLVLALSLLLSALPLTRLDALESNDMASARVVSLAPSAVSSADEAESFLAFFLAHGFSCCARCSILVGRLSVLPAELEDDEDDEEADPLDDGRPLLLPLLLVLPLPALRGLRAAALLEAVPLWNRPVEGRRLEEDEVDEEGRPVRVDELGLPVDGVDDEDERVDRRFRGAEARGIVACCFVLSLSLSLSISSQKYFRFWKTNEPDLPKRNGTNEANNERSKEHCRQRPAQGMR